MATCYCQREYTAFDRAPWGMLLLIVWRNGTTEVECGGQEEALRCARILEHGHSVSCLPVRDCAVDAAADIH